jgi:membrane-associated phospholipid phosphatase
LLLALTTAAVVSITSLMVLPAYGTPPYGYDFIGIHEGIRDGTLRALNPSVITGLVTFPSMHAAHAVILATASRWSGRLARPLMALNVAMFWSALFVGGHYLVDLLAGGLIGAAALSGSGRVIRSIVRTSASSPPPASSPPGCARAAG